MEIYIPQLFSIKQKVSGTFNGVLTLFVIYIGISTLNLTTFKRSASRIPLSLSILVLQRLTQ